MRFTTSYCQLNLFLWLRRFDVLEFLARQEPTSVASSTATASSSVVLYDYPQYVSAPPMEDVETCVLYYPSAEEEEAAFEQLLFLQQTRTLYPLLERAGTGSHDPVLYVA